MAKMQKFEEPVEEVKPKVAAPPPPPPPKVEMPKAAPAPPVAERISVDKKLFGKLAMAVVTGKITPITSGTGAMMNIARMVSGNMDINYAEATAIWDKMKADFYKEV